MVALRGVRSPDSGADVDQPVLCSAWEGLRYVRRNATLRGLAIAISVKTFSGGIVGIVVPLIVLRQLGGSAMAVGVALGMSGLAGMLSVLVVGRIDFRGRELRLLVVPMLATAPVLALLLVPAGAVGAAQPALGFAVLCLALLLMGLLEGPMDIGLFTIRQRRTATAWIGRAFAISMAANAIGYPVGSAVAGTVSETSLQVAIVLAIVACLSAAFLATRLVPRDDPAGEEGLMPAPRDGGTVGSTS